MLNTRTGEVAVSLAFLLVAILAFALSSFPPPLNPADPGPAFYPRLMAGGLVLFCLVTLARAFKNEPKPIGGEGDAWLGYLTALATLIYVLLLERIGYIAGSTGLLAGLMWLGGVRGPVRIILISVSYALLTYLIFSRVLMVPLP